MLADPEVKDPWAKATAKLARRGAGRTPFVISGAMLTAVDMVHVSPVAPYFVIPVEIDGESALAAIATGNSASAEGRAVTELADGNIRVAVVSPQAGMPLGMIDLTAAGTLVASWGYSGATFNVGRIHWS